MLCPLGASGLRQTAKPTVGLLVPPAGDAASGGQAVGVGMSLAFLLGVSFLGSCSFPGSGSFPELRELPRLDSCLRRGTGVSNQNELDQGRRGLLVSSSLDCDTCQKESSAAVKDTQVSPGGFHSQLPLGFCVTQVGTSLSRGLSFPSQKRAVLAPLFRAPMPWKKANTALRSVKMPPCDLGIPKAELPDLGLQGPSCASMVLGDVPGPGLHP